MSKPHLCVGRQNCRKSDQTARAAGCASARKVLRALGPCCCERFLLEWLNLTMCSLPLAMSCLFSTQDMRREIQQQWQTRSSRLLPEGLFLHQCAGIINVLDLIYKLHLPGFLWGPEACFISHVQLINHGLYLSFIFKGLLSSCHLNCRSA